MDEPTARLLDRKMAVEQYRKGRFRVMVTIAGYAGAADAREAGEEMLWRINQYPKLAELYHDDCRERTRAIIERARNGTD